MSVWIIAETAKEAKDFVAAGFGFDNESVAKRGLREAKETTDSYYWNRLKVFRVRTSKKKNHDPKL